MTKDSVQQFQKLLGEARESIVILGISPVASVIDSSAGFLVDLLELNPSLTIEIYYESDSEVFSHSLLLDTPLSPHRRSYDILKLHRNRVVGDDRSTSEVRGILAKMKSIAEARKTDFGDLEARVQLSQHNLRFPFVGLIVDSHVRVSFVTNRLPALEDYALYGEGDAAHQQVINYLEFLRSEDGGGLYLSSPGEELIQLYDKEDYPRGIYPRRAFYNTRFKRYSIWGLIFNRCGELLLHKRSRITKDNRLLWDKSVGGHVDLRDSSTSETAKRELVEELFLPDAEFTRYVRADLGDIIDFGEWNLVKRPEHVFASAFSAIGPADWIMFRATNENGDPLTEDRVSLRIISTADGTIVKKTIFLSDVFLLVAPPELMDTEDQMKKLVSLAEETGAADDHRLISVSGLRDWVTEEVVRGRGEEVFTDDLRYLVDERLGLLETFGAFIQDNLAG